MTLVTGGTGFIGGHLMDKLLVRGEPVRALVRRPGLFANTQVHMVQCDLVSGIGLTQALQDVDTVIHLAGVTKALSSAEYFSGNVQASENLARAIAALGRPVRVVHVSSLAALGPSLDGIPVSEDTEPHPLTHYGRSKVEGERVVRSILPDSVIVRPPVVYGPRDTDVFQLLKSISQGIVVQIAGGERYFSAIYVSDLVEGILVAAEHPGVEGRAYLLAHPKPVSWTEFGNIAARIIGNTPRLLRVPAGVATAAGFCAEVWSQLTRKPGIVSREKVMEAVCRYWTCTADRARIELGFEATTGIEEGLANALSWYREAGWLKY